MGKEGRNGLVLTFVLKAVKFGNGFFLEITSKLHRQKTGIVDQFVNR